jgi:hypothetical protein
MGTKRGISSFLTTLLILLVIPFVPSVSAYVTEVHHEDGTVEYQGTPEELQRREQFEQNAVTREDGARGIYTDATTGQAISQIQYAEQLETMNAQVMAQTNQSIEHARETGASEEDLRKADEEKRKTEQAMKEQVDKERAQAARRQMKVLISDENGKREI